MSLKDKIPNKLSNLSNLSKLGTHQEQERVTELKWLQVKKTSII